MATAMYSRTVGGLGRHINNVYVPKSLFTLSSNTLRLGYNLCCSGVVRNFSGFLYNSIPVHREFKVKSPLSSVKTFYSSSTLNYYQRTCWKCGDISTKKKTLFFCECGIVQKPLKDVTYFELFKIDNSFDVDLIQLAKVFKETQKYLHPDKFSLKPKDEQEIADQQSSLVNKAYDVLQRPMSRAIYMLELEGLSISESDQFTEAEFLMEVMEVNEDISSAKTNEELENLNVQNDGKIKECLSEISVLFREKRLADAKNAVMKLRYYTTISERMKQLQRDSF